MSGHIGSSAVGLRLGAKRNSPRKNLIIDRTKDVRIVGLIKDYARIHHKAPFVHGFSAAFRLLLLIRVFSAMYSPIADCDETFNYWEPLHLITQSPRPHGASQLPFQTWEYSPEYAIRSWAYLMQYLPVAGWLMKGLGKDKRVSFFATRIFLAFNSSLCEAYLTKSVSEVVSPRVGRYMLVILIFSAGMYESSTALLPSTYTMYTTTFALAFAFYPSRSAIKYFPSNSNVPFTPLHRTIAATCAFAAGALLGWPFALVLSFPFVLEEIFLPSGLMVSADRYAHFVASRLVNWLRTAFIASLIAVPLFLVDTLAYGRPVLVPLNIIVYNILSSRRGAGPELYGLEPWYYYILNLTLNFGPAFILALLSLPSLFFSIFYDRRRFDVMDTGQEEQKEHSNSNLPRRSSPQLLLLFRLAPFYLWFGLLSLQPHKEERFMFPAYPLICFNAAVTLCLARGWLEKMYTQATKSPYRASKTPLFSIVTILVLVVTSTFGLSRIAHTAESYHAPVSLLTHFANYELPRVVPYVNPTGQSDAVRDRLSRGLPPVLTPEERLASGGKVQYESSGVEKQDPIVDLTFLANASTEGEALRMCYGKEWYRFPTTFLVPDGVSVAFIKSDFDGILPKHFVYSADEYSPGSGLDENLGWLWPWKGMTRAIQPGFNDMNREEPDQYVPPETCDYLVDSFISPSSSSQDIWEEVRCLPFLDGSRSHALPGSSVVGKVRAIIERTLWLPMPFRAGTNQYSRYCLLRTTRESSLANKTV